MFCNVFSVIVENLNKDYRIYSRPVDRLIEALFRKPRHRLFPVLREISFSVSMHQSLGIIGDNGAGKSTLLKLLAGTITPTSGAIKVSGRISALLELGAGFHPDFTGRQNIFLNASLLGIPKEEINSNEKKIIDFSELHNFIDQPVKTYSSGMHVRLAFAIATTVNPDILIIDEALSVGDLSFQRKCIDRMNDFRERGKTMIFCSHSMYHVQELCEKTVWLQNGKIRQIGPSKEIIGKYEDYCNTKNVEASENQNAINVAEERGKDCRILDLGFETMDGRPLEKLIPLSEFIMWMEVEILSNNVSPNFGLGLILSDESIYAAAATNFDKIKCGPYKTGERIRIRLTVKYFPIREGTYRLIGAVSEKSGLFWYEYKYSAPITVNPNEGFGRIALKKQWDIQKVQESKAV